MVPFLWVTMVTPLIFAETEKWRLKFIGDIKKCPQGKTILKKKTKTG